MAKTESSMLPLGTRAPDFHLKDVVSQNFISLASIQAPAYVIMFICNHCPYVKHINPALIQCANDYQSRGVQFIAINSNDVEQYPEDAPLNMQKVARELGYPFPYLFDETQEVARAYHAACTPDFFVFDHEFILVYRGQFDDARPGNGQNPNGQSLREALERLLAHQAPLPHQKPSLGCNIKWRLADN
jgi:peroxiredoxin